MLTKLDVKSSRKSAAPRNFFSRLGLAAALLRWYRRHRRPLPWRSTNDPYRIWISEIMLQQTRAAAVIPYYERFLRRFPSLDALARSSETALLECWSGLGYYSRARNLRRAARHIVTQLGGKLPQTYEEWTVLPGVGPYTAAAVSSIAFQQPVAVLDGNVARVMARIGNHRGDLRLPRVREELRLHAQALLDRRHPGEFNQAVMELGATICLPRRPQCLLCPISGACEAHRLGVQDELPIKLAAREPTRLAITVAMIERNGSLLLRQRPKQLSLMPGFWELPQAEGLHLRGFVLGERLKSFRHSITHHQYTATVFRAATQGRPPAGYRWISRDRLRVLPLTTITRKALATLDS